MMWKKELVAKSESPTTAIRDRPATTAGAPLVPRLATPLRLSCGPREIAVALSGVTGRRRASTIRVFGPGTSWSLDRKSTRLNSSHGYISYAVFCLKKKKKKKKQIRK